MQQLLSLDPTLGFAIGLAFAFLILLSLELYNSRRVSRLTYPAYEYAQKRAEEEARRIIEEAQKEARRIVSTAETAGLALTSTRKQEGESAEHAYEAALKELMQKLETQLQESVRMAEESQAKISAALSSQLEAEGKEARAHLAKSGTEIEAEYRSRLEGELATALLSAKEEAAGYARARKAAVDEHITALVGEALRVVLQKNVPKEIHADLARAALEEAKARGVF